MKTNKKKNKIYTWEKLRKTTPRKTKKKTREKKRRQFPLFVASLYIDTCACVVGVVFKWENLFFISFFSSSSFWFNATHTFHSSWNNFALSL